MELILVKNKVKLFIQNNFFLLEEGLREVNHLPVYSLKVGFEKYKFKTHTHENSFFNRDIISLVNQ